MLNVTGAEYANAVDGTSRAIVRGSVSRRVPRRGIATDEAFVIIVRAEIDGVLTVQDLAGSQWQIDIAPGSHDVNRRHQRRACNDNGEVRDFLFEQRVRARHAGGIAFTTVPIALIDVC